MTQIKVIPIFNQDNPRLWQSCAGIWAAAVLTPSATSQERQNETINMHIVLDLEYRTNKSNLVFGAWDGQNMVGFIQGSCDNNTAIGNRMAVLPQYQSRHIGRTLLSNFERAAALDSKYISLMSLESAKNFYLHRAYHTTGEYEFIKDIRYVASCCVIPVFHIPSWLNPICQEIAAPYDIQFHGSIVNHHHYPMFIYRDEKSFTQGFAILTPTGPQICARNHNPQICSQLLDTVTHWAQNIPLNYGR